MTEQNRPVAIAVRGVTKQFGAAGPDQVTALDQVSVDIRENEFFTLLGPSGCGKTTLLRLIAGFDFPDAGEILLYGEDIAPLPPYKRPVNTVFQNYALFPHLTVGGNIGFGLEMLGKPKAEVDASVDRMLKLVHMGELKHRRVSQISGGQQQRVALARALAPRPKVLLLDEPLSALDLKLRKEMQIELKRLQHETGITFIFVTHDQEEALTMSDRIAVMSKGRILQVGQPRQIYDEPSSRFVASFIGDTNFLEAFIERVEKGRALLTLPGGAAASAAWREGLPATRKATVAIRPEHAKLTAAATGALKGTLDNIVYFGTDTHYHLKLDSGEDFMVRMQNSEAAPEAYRRGEKTGVALSANAVQILGD